MTTDRIDDFDTFCNAIASRWKATPNETISTFWYHDYITAWNHQRTPLHEYVDALALDEFESWKAERLLNRL